MDIFIKGIPAHANYHSLQHAFSKPLSEFGIDTYHCHKIRGKACAILSILDKTKAEQFLAMYGHLSDPKPNQRPKKFVRFAGKALNLTRSNRTQPKPWERSALEKELQDAQKLLPKPPIEDPNSVARQKTFSLTALSCGSWDYDALSLCFISEYTLPLKGGIIFGKSHLTIVQKGWDSELHVDVPYFSIKQTLLGKHGGQVSFTLGHPPKFYRMSDMAVPEDITTSMKKLSLDKQDTVLGKKKVRTAGLGYGHSQIAGMSYVYQIQLANRSEFERLSQLLKRNPGLPSADPYHTKTSSPAEPLLSSYENLMTSLRNYSILQELTFPIRFQIQRLAQNGVLPPARVTKLLPVLQRLVGNFGEEATVVAVRQLCNQLDFPGSHTEALNYKIDTLSNWLQEAARGFNYGTSIYKLVSDHEHLVLVHKAIVTPSGVFLLGPTAEVTNRVLRRYSRHTEHFIRVTFADEDHEAMHYDPRASLNEIYNERFRSFLEGSIYIAGRHYSFLGFSHSSLRSQTCWFSSVFSHGSELMHPEEIIKQLGDFQHIRSPAKCAARIGQAFTDTNGSITIDAQEVIHMDDVERNERVFSDGCGTISLELLQYVWQKYILGRRMKATTLQLRFAGAKGVVSLDSTLEGRKLCIRPSMTKFEAPMTYDIEICGAASKPLPMYLNQPLIKILEDLGTDCSILLDLQKIAVEELREITRKPANAATFLELNRIGISAQIPSLIRRLEDIELDFQDDTFLRNLIELAVLNQLREIKYRSRIRVKDGHTLYGIMDETGILKEGQIYCVTETPEDGRKVLKRHEVIITRAPALHPGDVQIVECVDVPKDSPLDHLRNCVVFSQHGNRDLPSMLSGGDLDGDLYNVIFDARLLPKRLNPPAAYERPKPIDINREVVRKDMSDFFLKFMETDQLGRISKVHQQLADRHEEGTFHPDCLLLAEMASVAVDFSKTGIPVNLSNFPKYDKIRPDFMASGPRVLIGEMGAMISEESWADKHGFDPTADPDARIPRFYESPKVLGQLYRAIDEKKFLNEIQSHSPNFSQRDSHRPSMMDTLWNYVKRQTKGIAWQNYSEWAKRVRDDYESHVVDVSSWYSPHPNGHLQELEVFSGCLLGRSSGTPNKRQREYAKEMKEYFEPIVQFNMDNIKNGEDSDSYEALPRAVACLAVGLEDKGRRQSKVLVSWNYIAASACLKEMELYFGVLPLKAT